MTTDREALRRISEAMNDKVGNLPELPGIYPDYLAPIVRLNSAGEREIVLARWGLPSLKDQTTEKPNRGTTNVRHPWFDDWKDYLGVEHRCLVPLTRFAEPCKLDDGSSGNARVVCPQRRRTADLLCRSVDRMGGYPAQGRRTDEAHRFCVLHHGAQRRR